MKKSFLCLGLTMLGLAGQVLAQTENLTERQKDLLRTKTDKTFNVKDRQVDIKDIVQLKQGKMILSMLNVKDYENFRNLDSILMNFRRDIAFYKDSLDAVAGGHVRIDYVISPEYSFKKIRFKKYDADGVIYINRTGEVSKLKLEQDTVRIIVEKLLYQSKCTLPYAIQATFILDNYTDVDKIIADRVELRRILDTLEQVSQNKKAKQAEPSHFPQFSIVYNPYYTGGKNFNRYSWIVTDENKPYNTRHKGNFLTVDANIGAAIVMNTFTPQAEIGISYNQTWGVGRKEYSFYRLFTSSYYFFGRDANNNLLVQDNWFINAVVGSQYEDVAATWMGQVVDFGVGYLYAQKGNYFKGVTMKVFTDIRLKKGITLSPEFIMTNNFKQIFPGLTFKVF